jgi:hypothetical protein
VDMPADVPAEERDMRWCSTRSTNQGGPMNQVAR